MRGLIRFLSGFMLGGVVGAALATLFAPASGDDLRSDIQERAQQIQIEVRQAAESRRSELEQQLAQLRTPRKAE